MEKQFYFIRTFTTRNFLIISLSLWIFFIYSVFLYSLQFNFTDFLIGLKNWDSGHFLGIAQSGYSKKYQFAFFPLYPSLIKAISMFTGNYLLSGIIISLISTVLGFKIFYSILKKEFKLLSKKIVISLLVFPTSFYLLLPYSEAIFFLLTMTFFYYLKKNIYLSGLICGLSIVTRITGLALLPVLIYELILNKDKKHLYSLLLAGLPFIIYSTYLFSRTDNFIYFLVAQDHWQRALSSPLAGFTNLFVKVFSTRITQIDLNDVINLSFGIFGAGLVLRSFRFLNLKYSLFALFAVAIPLLSGNLTSIPRFILVIFPIFILIGKFNKKLWIVYLVCSIFLLIFFGSTFIKGGWVS